MELTGAQILVECLREQGVDVVFGYPGGTILDVYDALYQTPDIRHYLVSHEQGAAHAADGYARSTGRVGVCLATSGPGCTNLTTGIATAYMDSSPLVAITCNVSSKLLGKDSFQEVDITGITRPITKWNRVVKDVSRLANVVRQAFLIARSGRPGPVLIDVTKDVTSARAPYEPLPLARHRVTELPNPLSRRLLGGIEAPEPSLADVEGLIDLIRGAERPLIVCGGGVVRSRAQDELLAFARRVDAPVAITVMGGGGFAGDDPLSTGMIGMHGSQASNRAVDDCDLLVAVGCRFSDRVALKPATFASRARIAQIDIDATEVGKNIRCDHHVLGDARRVLELVNDRLDQQDHATWKEHVFSFATETLYEEGGDHLTPKQINETIARLLPEDTIVATDVGQHQMWAIQHFHFRHPGQLLTSGGFGAMGFGLGAAIGAQVGNPARRILHVTGDGSFRMNCNELSTVEHYGLPVITVVYDNAVLGMVHQWQTLIYDRRYAETTLDRGPDWIRLAEAYGLSGRRVSSVTELEDALGEALSCGHGYVIDAVLDPDEMVRPMVPAGQHITSFLAV
ncbi:biosynthetic-type acetolactate synthase large subunit [Olsenella sp. HMSC062G07]|uniref:biosynthetic-type acetolactate synthase large subunit n=1 Tax=Olsenella sp. HMSC062G07 TaxID=1739330 RepID=UPI0008A507EF|nr:biosynthetic-type acetolactate synthase large subunit [Olsenella sp. HMSC062G07]OFK23886.1 acetolactate synthase catalytic subunit [Olsenella sp. HMSC062G07]